MTTKLNRVLGVVEELIGFDSCLELYYRAARATESISKWVCEV